MKFTDEQEEIIENSESCIVEATAGSGKTSTVLEYARRRPDKKKLYIVFNKSVQKEAEKRFAEKGVKNIEITTAHSLAYRRTNAGKRWSITNSVDLTMLVNLLGLKDSLTSYSDAQVALRTFEKYLHDYETDLETFFKNNEIENALIKKHVKKIFNAMKDNEIEITHDFYMKMFSIKKPKLNYDIILADEFQDSAGSLLSVIDSQDSDTTKIMIGDSNQSLYRFRGAINALDIMRQQGYKELHLTNSFRFPQSIADISRLILTMKNVFDENHKVLDVKGLGADRISDARPVNISRYNSDTLSKLIEKLQSGELKKGFYVEGGFMPSLFSDRYNIYDVLGVFTKSFSRVKHPLLKKFTSFGEMKAWAEDNDEVTLNKLCNLVKTYQTNLFSFIKHLKEIEIKEKPDYYNDEIEIFYTAHKSKGLEFPKVKVSGSFALNKYDLRFLEYVPYIDYSKNKEYIDELLEKHDIDLDTYKQNAKTKRLSSSRKSDEQRVKAFLNDEINATYVAITRSQEMVVF